MRRSVLWPGVTKTVMRRALAVASLAIVVVSCDTPPAEKAPTGEIGAITQAAGKLLAPDGDVSDRRLDEALEDADLRTTLGAQGDIVTLHVRKTRAAANAGWRPASSTVRPRLARMPTAVGLFSVPMFAETLAAALDASTKRSGTSPGQPQPVTSNETSDGVFTTTTVSIVQTLSSSGSKVTLSMSWTYTTVSIDVGTNLTVLQMNDDRTMVGSIDVCPDAAGTVSATLAVKQTVKTNAKGRITTREQSSDNGFAGAVSDDARLQSLRQTFHEKHEWTSTTGSGAYDVNLTVGYNAAANGGFLGGLQASGVTGTVASATGDATREGRIGAMAGFSIAVDALSLDKAYQEAQKLWRNGRCVMVEAPSYSAETPIEVSDQERKQHTEEVDVDSETDFSVRLKHRFGGGSVSAALRAELKSGKEKLQPERLEGGSGSLKYRAPTEEDKTATALLRSTSKRGIGTLVLEFHTGGGLTLSISGELKGNSSFMGTTTRILDRVTIGPLTFKKSLGEIWEAEGTWRAELSSHVNALGESMTCTGAESGDVTMMARREKRGDRTVWVIDPLETIAEGKGQERCEHSIGGTTLRGVTIPRFTDQPSSGDAAAIFIGVLERIVIPAEGGRVRVSGSQGDFTGEGTATATSGAP